METLPRIEGSAKRLLGHKWVIGALIIGVFGCCVWFWELPPEPGIAIAVLGAMAAVVTFAEMTSTQKLLATVAVFALMAIEIRDIRTDRIWTDKQAHEQRQKDQEQFSKIAGGIDKSIQQSQQQFTETTSGLRASIDATNTTIANTRPKAIIELSSADIWPSTLPILANRRLSFNVHFLNAGSDTAKGFFRAAKIYVGQLDDLSFENRMVADFDSLWNGDDPAPTSRQAGINVVPNGHELFSFRSDVLTDGDVREILGGKKTLYLIARFAWTDDTGHWITDWCGGYQNLLADLVIVHFCPTGNAVRYKNTSHRTKP